MPQPSPVAGSSGESPANFMNHNLKALICRIKKCFLIFAPLWVSVSEADRRKNVNYRPKIKCTCLNEGDAMCRWGKEDTVVMHNVCTVPSDCSKRLHRVSS